MSRDSPWPHSCITELPRCIAAGLHRPLPTNDRSGRRLPRQARRTLDPMEVRRVRPDEWQALRDLRLRALAADPDAFGNTLRTRRSAPMPTGRRTPTARRGRVRRDDAGRLRRHGHGRSGARPPGCGGPVYGMWVAPEARGQGCGGALVDAVEAWAREAGYENIGLGVTTMNASRPSGCTRRRATQTPATGMPLRDGTDLLIQIMARRL